MTTSTLFRKVLTATAVTGVAVFSYAQININEVHYSTIDGSEDKVALAGVFESPLITTEENGDKKITIPSHIFYEGKTYTVAEVINGSWLVNVIELPNTIEKIGQTSFNTPRIKHIILGNSVKEIQERAFYRTKITNISLPSSLSILSSRAFDETMYLQNIDVNENNPHFSSQDGVLYNKDKTQLIAYPQGKLNEVFTIPNSVTEIKKFAFQYNKKLKNITIPSSVKKIETGAFIANHYLKEIICESQEPAFVEEKAFLGVRKSNVIVKVPKGAKEKYEENEEWSGFTIVEDETLSTKDNKVISSVSAKVYPNPTTGIFFIETEIPTTADIFTMAGQVVKSVKLNKGKSQVDISHLPSGIYFVKVNNTTKKIIKK